MKQLYNALAALLVFGSVIGNSYAQNTLVVDPTFGFNGFSRIDFTGGSNNDVPAKVILTAEGVIVGGATIVENFDYRSSIAKYNSAGKVDAAFGGGTGKTMAKFNARSEGLGFAVQTDGKIVGVGKDNESNSGSGQKPFIFRLNSNGTVDLTFADSGYVRKRYDPVSGGAHFGVVQQLDGKLVAFGHSYGNINGGSAGFGAMRFNQDGTLDATYSSDGITRITAPSDAQPGGGLLQPDGKVLIAGATSNGTTNVITLVRFDSTGNPDVTFGDQGIAASLVPCRDGRVECHLSGDKIIVTYTSSAPEGYAVARFNMDGTRDMGFLESVLTGAFTSGKAYSSAVTANGDIYVAGQAMNDGGIAKFNAGGGVATSFGTNGFLPFNLSAGGTSYFTSITMQGEDVIALGADLASRGGDFVLVRLSASTAEVARYARMTTSISIPNPASGLVTLALDAVVSGPVTIDVIDAVGRKVKHINQHVMSGENVLLNVSDISPGCYTARITSANIVSTAKIVVAR